MSNVYIISEGQTEQTFVREVLAPYMAIREVYLYPALIGTPGHKGGSIKFDRAHKDLRNLLRQRMDTYVTTMFDFFRIDSQWPGKNQLTDPMSAEQKAAVLEQATADEIIRLYAECNPAQRFIPYIEMHEFEALLFSNTQALSDGTGIPVSALESVLIECGEPEEINSTPDKAPSKRLEQVTKYEYRKVAMGVAIGRAIGIDAMRLKCPHFNAWLDKLEAIQGK